MKSKILGLFTLFLVLIGQMGFAQTRIVSGLVSDGAGEPMAGVAVTVKGTKSGTLTDFDGKFSIEASTSQTLVFSYLGMETREIVASSTTVNVKMKEGAQQFEEVVVTALGIKREEKTLPYASQQIKQKELNITQSTDIKAALAGKVAGVQIQSQAGSKLGNSGKIRLRGTVSLTSDGEPLYIVDNIPITDPNVIDMENVASINTLKGPNATALYGQRAENGVIIITTKKGSDNKMNVEIISSLTFDKVAYLPKYQNEYGQGYSGQDDWGTFSYDSSVHPSYFAPMNGGTYNLSSLEDASWGPKFDGRDYFPWYTWFPDSPYYGKAQKYTSQKDNVKDFYDTGVTSKNGISLMSGTDKYSARFSYTNIGQSGLLPYSDLKKNLINLSLDFNVTEKFSIGTTINYVTDNVNGDFDDGYSNNTSGSFNQWFGRDIEISKLKELRNLKTPDGYGTSWNWWGPDSYEAGTGYAKPTFWLNPYYWLSKYTNNSKSNSLIGDIHANYKINDNWSANVIASRNQKSTNNFWSLPYDVELTSAHDLYMAYVNSFGRKSINSVEDNYSGFLNYKSKFGKFDFSGFVGAQIRKNSYYSNTAEMDKENFSSGGLLIPDLYTYGNSKEQVVPITYENKKQVNSIIGKASIGYDDFLFLDATLRKDYSSALPKDKNGYIYPSLGTSFIFTKFVNQDWLSFGKFRAGWAQVGNDVDALALSQTYPTYQEAYNGYNGNPVMWTNSQIKDAGIKPAINSSFEAGVDLKFLNNRLGFSFTYYNETRKDEIIPIAISAGTGYSTYLTNAGKSNRSGIEAVLNGTPIKTTNFEWNSTFNFAKNKSKILELPGDLTSMNGPGGTSAFDFVSIVHHLDGDWGQLQGSGFKTDANGNKVINDNGLYVVEQNKQFGSILPDFTGGFLNSFSYKDFTLTAMIDFQKGGKFFSLTEMWGSYTGLLENTAGNNDLGNPQRDAVADGGGVHVVGVDASGATVDTYVEAHDYYSQWYANRLAEPFVHNASYIKLRDVQISYTFSGSKFKNLFHTATLGVIGRNLLLLSVSKDNKNRWDPSEMSKSYGEDGQLPGTRSYGLNLKITF